MSSISQLDGTCSANCCNADGASDEPCESCKAVRIESDPTPQRKKDFGVPENRVFEPHQEPEEKTISEPVVTSIKEPLEFTGTTGSSSRETSQGPGPIPTKTKELSDEPPAKKAKVTPKKSGSRKTSSRKTSGSGTSSEPMADNE